MPGAKCRQVLLSSGNYLHTNRRHNVFSVAPLGFADASYCSALFLQLSQVFKSQWFLNVQQDLLIILGRVAEVATQFDSNGVNVR